MTRTDLEQAVARAIYGAAFENRFGGLQPEPGWCWEKAGDVQRDFCRKQARAALSAIEGAGWVLVEMPKERPMRSRLGPGET